MYSVTIMSGNFFDKDYATYWKERVENTITESKVPDETVERFFISKLGISRGDFLLDLGCGHGRLYPLLHEFADHIEGVDINKAAIDEALHYPYSKLAIGSAEKTTLSEDYFDKIVAWATYDGVEQDQGLIEANRILKQGGALLITGKNKDYEPDDLVAFVAERNAKLKDFPNHFTDVYGMIGDAKLFGFMVRAGYGFVRRGDFGELKYIDLLDGKQNKFYEFLLILEKVGTPSVKEKKICFEFSDVAKALAKQAGFDDIKSFFAWHKEKYHD